MFKTSLRSFSSACILRDLASDLKNPTLYKTKGYINGEWVDGSDGEKFEVNDPALDESSLIGEISSMSEKDFAKAIDVAQESFEKFRATSGKARGQLLRNLYELMQENKDDLARIIVRENGKPYADALGEIEYSSSFFDWFAGEAPRVYGDIISSANTHNRILTLKQPIGVCGILTPWNFPSAMIARKLGAAIATGCTTVIKPASETPLSALALAQLLESAGFEKGVVNVLPASDAALAGRLLCESPIVKKVSFTGSTRVGKILMSQSSSTLKKLSMELGGNAPFIVFDDTDLDEAVQGAIASKFRSSGQTCICANRLFVHESVYSEFSAKLTKKLEEVVRLGNGIESGVTHGPLIHSKSMAKVRAHIEDAVSKGAKVLYGGKVRPDLGKNFHELAVLGDVTPDMLIFQEETFGPVAPLIKFKTEEEVIKLANDVNVGLAGYFYSNDVRRVLRVAESLNVGMIGANTGAISEAALPFGGIMESGFGREGSKYGIDDYVITKSLVIGGI